MARSLDQQIAALRKLTLPAGLDELRAALAARTPRAGVLIAEAAKLVAEHHLDHLVPELVDAFAALVPDGAKRDPQCRGKVAIANTLLALERWEDRVFEAGLRIVQREGPPSFAPGGPPPDDTAAHLRGLCGLAHVHFLRSDALDVAAELLLDPKRVTRRAAAEALGDSGYAGGAALLRYAILREGVVPGDEDHDEPRSGEDPEVISAMFESLFRSDRERAGSFAMRMLAVEDSRAEAAALALGSARYQAALDALVAWCEDRPIEQRHRVGYLAIALLRSDAGNAHLLDAVRTGARGDALAAAQALATFKHDASIAEQLRVASARVRDKAVRRAIDELLAG